MTHIVLSNIKWEDAPTNVPDTILVIGVPEDWENDYLDIVGDEISEVYGYCHDGFEANEVTLDGRHNAGRPQVTDQWPKIPTAIMQGPDGES